MERHEFPLFIPAPYSLPPRFKRWGVKWGEGNKSKEEKQKSKADCKRLLSNSHHWNKETGFPPRRGFKEQWAQYLLWGQMGHEGKPGRHGDWEGEGWNRLSTISRLGGVGRLHDAIRRATEGTEVNTILHIVLFQLGQDVFSIRVLPQGGNVRPDLYRHQKMWTECTRIGPSPQSSQASRVFCPPRQK